MRKLTTSAAIVLALLLGVSALAADLDQAKRDGLVGERADGYLGLVVDSVPRDVADLVEEVNAKRRAEYQRIADSNSLELSQVEALAGKKAIERTAAGGWVRFNGGWERK
ncbi:MAG: YdbL family protein [Pseudomonadales bacterium]